jgi:diadenosine tetraphosphate (Ap4A) HIT family hydrolase
MTVMATQAWQGFQRGPACPACPLCDKAGGELVWQDGRLRVILANEREYPGFCRVVWSAHIAELSELDVADQRHLMEVVIRVEQILREIMSPDKINLASLGNQVPHLHWHVIPRFFDDAHFPSPVWAAKRHTTDPALLAGRTARAAQLPAALRAALG